jgi:hypothetical protein
LLRGSFVAEPGYTAYWFVDQNSDSCEIRIGDLM